MAAHGAARAHHWARAMRIHTLHYSTIGHQITLPTDSPAVPGTCRHQHEIKLLRRRRTPPCKHDGSRAAEAQRARRAADPRHESTHGHCIDARCAVCAASAGRASRAAAGEVCASRRRAAPAWAMAHGWRRGLIHTLERPRSSTFTAAMRQPLRVFRPGFDRHHAPKSPDARSATPTSCGNEKLDCGLCPNST
jgi:hypothetical protein